jgi:predicted nucleotidyltransferase component of viral defense system
MIEKSEIDAKSAELGVHVSHVQRDYVFGWILSGLFQPSNPFSQQLVLKGGNAFRKAYFEHARYSNDLDFSTQTSIDETELRAGIMSACEFARRHSGVEFEVADTRIGSRVTSGEEGRMFEGRVYFRSFYGEEDVIIRVDVDVKEFDRIVLPIQQRNLVHAYSDADTCRTALRVHTLEELLASKLVALLRRRHSPDLFDFVHTIFVQRLLEVSRRQVVSTFLKKTIYEPTPQVARGLLLDLPFAVFRGLWEEYLVFPKMSAIGFEDAERSFRDTIVDLFAMVGPQPTLAVAAVGSPPSYFGGEIRNTLIEGGRLQRVLRVVYDGVERRIEPYALAFKRRKDGVGQEYFYGYDLSGGRSGNIGIKSLFPDKVSSAQLTDEAFEPRYPIEMAKGGMGFFSNPSFSSTPYQARRTRPSFGRIYLIECPYCSKRFRHHTSNTHLNPHKDRYGNACYGRTGFLASVE